MKILAEVKYEEFIAQFERHELEKFLNLYYDKMDKIKVGDVIDLGKGHDFNSKTEAALRATNDLLKNHADVLKAITTGITVSADATEKRGNFNRAALADLQLINEADCSKDAWDMICNAMEFLK